MRKEKVIQFGEGGFLRGFVDWILQYVNEKTDFCGSVVVVQPIKEGLCDALMQQNCEYTHICRGAEGIEKKKIDVISRCVKPYDDYNEYLKLAENPDFRFIISNTTEAGICYDAADKKDSMPHKSFPAKLTALLNKRFSLGLDGFIFLPCELIEKNGEKLKEIILKYAEQWNLGAEFEKWINEKNIFCNTLVDRINTGFPEDEAENYNDNLLNASEYFHLWVIEGSKTILDEIPFDKTGLNIIVTDNLSMYRTRKVRILNGAHTALVPYAMLRGFDTVKSCVDDEDMREYIKKCVFDEIIPTLDLPEEELIEYAKSVLERFSNPYIKHYLSSIALNSFSKFKVRVLPSILEYKKRFEKEPETLMCAFDAFYEFYQTDMANDDTEVIKFMREHSKEEVWQKLCE